MTIMKSTLILLAGLTIFLCSSTISKAQETDNATTRSKGPLFYKEYYTKIHMEQKTVDIELLKVISKSGNVLLLPGDDDKIIVEADIVITSMSKKWQKRFMDKYMNLEFSKDKGRMVFHANFSGNRSNGTSRTGYVLRHLGTPGSKINFTMYVPQSVYVYLYDGSGDLEVKNLANSIEINDGSGSILVESVTGNVKVYDNAGDIKIENLMSVGEIVIHDESGNIYGNDIYGNMDIHDGSGSIYLEDVNGMVDIHDGSGNIDAQLTDGLVNVRSDGSGSKHISYSNNH